MLKAQCAMLKVDSHPGACRWATTIEHSALSIRKIDG
jgi:hypothetical protein